MRTTNTIPHKRLSIGSAAILVSFLTLLTACDSNPIEKIQSLTEDKYPVANMPDEPLETSLEINIEPKRLAMTSSWSAGVKDDGTLWTWGTDGLLRDTKTGQDPTPRQVEGVNDAVAVSGADHMLLLREDGTVWGWGSNSKGEIDPNDKDTFITELRQIKGVSDVVDVSAGIGGSSYFINKQGTVSFLGSNSWKLFNNSSQRIESPTQITGINNIVKIDGNAEYFLALDRYGNLFSNKCIEGTKLLSKNPQIQICKFIFDKKVVDISEGISNIVLLEDGTVWSWGDDEYSAQGNRKENVDQPEKIKGLARVVSVNSKSANTIDGDLYTWGTFVYKSNHSPIGSTKDNIYRPTLISKNINVKKYGLGSFADYSFIDDKGNAWMWGDKSDRGQWGTGEITEDYMSKEFVLSLHESLFNTHANK